MPRLLTTIWCDDDDEWNAATTLVDRRQARNRLAYLRDILRQAPDHDALIVVGSLGMRDRYIDLVAAGLVKLLPRRRRPLVIVTDATWEVGSRSLGQRLGRFGTRVLPALARAAIRAVDGPHVRYCVLSSDEVTTFPSTWRVDAERVRFTPFFISLFRWATAAARDDGFVFAGGESLRDYDVLLDAVDGLDVPVRIASGSVHRELPNVRSGRVDHDEFMDLLVSCRAMVVPLVVANRSAGQQTYLNAMALAKPVIVTDAPGVADYVDHGRTGIVVPPDPAALRDALGWVLDPANAEEVRAMGERARAEVWERFDPSAYRRRLLELAELELGPVGVSG